MLKNTYIFLVQIDWKCLPMFRKICLEKLSLNVQIESHVVRIMFFGLQVKHRKFSYAWFSVPKSPRFFAVLEDKILLLFDVWTDFMVLNIVPMKRMSPNLRSKRFRLASEQRKTEDGLFRFLQRDKWNESHFSRVLWLSFLIVAPKPSRNACYAGYMSPESWIWSESNKKKNIFQVPTSKPSFGIGTESSIHADKCFWTSL